MAEDVRTKDPIKVRIESVPVEPIKVPENVTRLDTRQPLPIKDLDPTSLSYLAERFRMDLFKTAGKVDPLKNIRTSRVGESGL